jgi:predicted nucleic acid-binding protein
VNEVTQVIRQSAAMRLHGGIIYDALLLGCARKVNAQRIYTWNEKHFRLVAPDLADRITTP